MAQHYKIEEEKIKKYFSKLFKEFIEEYPFLKPIKKTFDCFIYTSFKNIKIAETRQLNETDFNRYIIEIQKKNLSKEVKEYIDKNFLDDKEQEIYIFEYNKEDTKRVLYFVI